MCNTPVEVQFTSAGCLNYPCRAPVAWFRKAADQGLAEAQTDLGWAYENGAGVPQDNTQAVAWYRKAAEQGHPEAKRKLESAETEIKIKQQKDEQEEEARRQQQLEDQARAGGYQKTSVETFVLDGRDLAGLKFRSLAIISAKAT
jgi:TPR repeat protein